MQIYAYAVTIVLPGTWLSKAVKVQSRMSWIEGREDYKTTCDS